MFQQDKLVESLSKQSISSISTLNVAPFSVTVNNNQFHSGGIPFEGSCLVYLPKSRVGSFPYMAILLKRLLLLQYVLYRITRRSTEVTKIRHLIVLAELKKKNY